MPDRTTFWEAVRGGDRDLTNEMVKHDPALAGARDDSDVSAILNALYRGHHEVVAVLLAARPALDVFDAAALGDVAALGRALAEDPSRAVQFSADGFTALHLAAFFARPEAARALLDRGAEPGAPARNPSRVTPLHSAAARNQVEIARMLLEAGAAPDAQQHGGWTALHSAAKHGTMALLELLLAHGSDPRQPAEDGRTARAFAEESGHAEAAARLLAAETG